MTISLRYSLLFVFLVTWSIVGYPVLAIVTNALEQPTTAWSILFRCFALGSAILLLFSASLTKKSKAPLNLFLIFWSLYFVRLYLATVLDAEDLRMPESTYWTFGFGVSFFPALVVLLSTKIQTLDQIYQWLVVMCLAGVAIALVVGSTMVTTALGESYDIQRLNVASLNPISMGHLGVTAMLLGISAFSSGRAAGRHLWIMLALIVLGTATAVLSNSRGPLIAMTACMALLFMAAGQRKRTIAMGIAFAVMTIYFAFSNGNVLFSEVGVIQRFVTLSQGGDASSIARLIAYQGALNQSMESPIFGSGIEERVTQFYPHNLVLEAFMSTGAVGGGVFVALTAWAAARAWRLLRSGSRHLWLGLLAFQYILGGMLSGSIYGSGTMWVLMALVLSTSPILGRVRPANRRDPQAPHAAFDAVP